MKELSEEERERLTEEVHYLKYKFNIDACDTDNLTRHQVKLRLVLMSGEDLLKRRAALRVLVDIEHMIIQAVEIQAVKETVEALVKTTPPTPLVKPKPIITVKEAADKLKALIVNE